MPNMLMSNLEDAAVDRGEITAVDGGEVDAIDGGLM